MEKDSLKSPKIFVVGNSRSGTTLVARILGSHPEVLRFIELHFFEELWSLDDKNKNLNKHDAVKIAAHLLSIQRKDYLFQGDIRGFTQEAENIVNTLENNVYTSEQVFDAFLVYETLNNGKSIPCENTPRNVFYINEILELFPEAKVINMIRDPRDILLSQKRKWRRFYLRKGGIPVKEVLRVWNNYHPITISKLWNSSVGSAAKFAGNDRVRSLRYEDLIDNPDQTIKNICEFIGIDFRQDMLDVSQGGSSFVKDGSGEKGVSKDRSGAWRNGGLNSSEIYLCQKITGDIMKKHAYSPVALKPNPLSLIYYMVTFPIKIMLSIVLNLNRMRNISETIKRRLA